MEYLKRKLWYFYEYYFHWTLCDIMGSLFKSAYLNGYINIASLIKNNFLIFDDKIYETFKGTNKNKSLLIL